MGKKYYYLYFYILINLSIPNFVSANNIYIYEQDDNNPIPFNKMEFLEGKEAEVDYETLKKENWKKDIILIDEWPQFINVIKGEMSLVGPRPERPEWVEEFRKNITYYDLRHLVRPGITGWAQVTHGYTTGTEGAKIKLQRDLYYVKHLGFQLDAIVVFRTFSALGGKIGRN